MTRLAVLISGRGSNLEALIHACKNGALNAEVTDVISHRPEARGLDLARKHRITTHVVDHQSFSKRAEFDIAIAQVLRAARPNLIIMAGFMRVLGADVVNEWSGRMLNIHPSLLPRHPGLNTHAKALAAGDTEHGASVHHVTAELDAGPVVKQVSVPVLATDTVESLAARVLEQEHQLIVEAVKIVMSNLEPLACSPT